MEVYTKFYRSFLLEFNKKIVFFVQNIQKMVSLLYIGGKMAHKSLSFCVKKLLEKKAARWYDIIGMMIGLGDTILIWVLAAIKAGGKSSSYHTEN